MVKINSLPQVEANLMGGNAYGAGAYRRYLPFS